VSDLGWQPFRHAKVREAWPVLVLSLLRLIIWGATASELPMNAISNKKAPLDTGAQIYKEQNEI
jgi:hypothetical protein